MEVGADKTTELAQAADDATESIDELRKSTKEYLDGAFALQNAQDDVADTVQRLTDQLAKQREENVKGAGSLVGNTEAARDNRDMAEQLVRKYSELMIETANNGQSTENLSKEFIDLMNKMFGANAATQGYIDMLTALKVKLDAIQSKNVTVRVNYEQNRSFGQGHLEGMAHGGIYGGAMAPPAATGGVRGGFVPVNEQGLELARVPNGDVVSLPHGSTVIPHGQSMSMLGQAAAPAAGQPIQLYGGGLGQLVWDWLEGEARGRGLKVMFG
jgi:hypothetical protein